MSVWVGCDNCLCTVRAEVHPDHPDHPDGSLPAEEGFGLTCPLCESNLDWEEMTTVGED